jgi:hypothetical protein
MIGMFAAAELSERKISITRGPTGASISMACTVPHVRAEMSCKSTDIAIDSLGDGVVVPNMPAFLDDLLKPATDRIFPAEQRAEAVISAARRTRLTDDILQALGTRDGKGAADFVARWRGAVSLGLVERLQERLRKAYEVVARHKVRAAWLGALFPLVIYSLVIELYAAPVIPPLMMNMTDTFQPIASALWDAIFLLVPLWIVWTIAGNRARWDAGKMIGGIAKRRPSQGWWPAFVAVCMIVPHVALIASDVSGDTVGLPYEVQFAALPVLRHWEAVQRRAVVEPQRVMLAPAKVAHRGHQTERR